MTNDPVLIAYTVKDRPGAKSTWRRIGVAFPHDRGAGLTVLLDALPLDGRIVLVEPKADLTSVTDLPAPPPAGPFGRRLTPTSRDSAEYLLSNIDHFGGNIIFMTEQPRDLVLEYLRRIDERTRATQLDIEELKSLANIVRNDAGNLKREN